MVLKPNIRHTPYFPPADALRVAAPARTAAILPENESSEPNLPVPEGGGAAAADPPGDKDRDNPGRNASTTSQQPLSSPPGQPSEQKGKPMRGEVRCIGGKEVGDEPSGFAAAATAGVGEGVGGLGLSQGLGRKAEVEDAGSGGVLRDDSREWSDGDGDEEDNADGFGEGEDDDDEDDDEGAGRSGEGAGGGGSGGGGADGSGKAEAREGEEGSWWWSWTWGALPVRCAEKAWVGGGGGGGCVMREECLVGACAGAGAGDVVVDDCGRW